MIIYFIIIDINYVVGLQENFHLKTQCVCFLKLFLNTTSRFLSFKILNTYYYKVYLNSFSKNYMSE